MGFCREPLERSFGCNWVFKFSLSVGVIKQVPIKSITNIVQNFLDVFSQNIGTLDGIKAKEEARSINFRPPTATIIKVVMPNEYPT